MKAFFSAAVLLGFTLPLQAGPVQPKEIAADAQWLIHIDVDSAMQTTPAQHCLENCFKTDEAAAHLKKITTTLGFDPLKQLHSITVYGRTLKPGEGVAIIKAEFNKEHLIEMGKKHAGLETTQHGDYTLYTAEIEHRHRDRDDKKKDDKDDGDKDDHDQEHSITGCFYADNALVVGRTVSEVKAALDVLNQGKSLAADSPLLTGTPKAVTVQTAAVGLDKMKWPKDVPAALQASSFRMAVGEVKGQSFGSVTVTATDAETAEQMGQVVEGGKALAALRAGENEDVQKMLKQFKVQVKDTTTTLSWEFDTQKTMKLVQQLHEQERTGRRERRERPGDDDKKEPGRPRPEKKDKDE